MYFSEECDKIYTIIFYMEGKVLEGFRKPMLNQVGYNVKQKKMAVVKMPGSYEIKDEQGRVVTGVGTREAIHDPLCRESLYKLDLSKVDKPGKYQLVHPFMGECGSFTVGEDVYREAHNAMIKALYFQRCGCALEEKYAGVYTHAACHLDKVQVWSDRSIEFEAVGGWHDAGDYGRYITPAAVTIGHLIYAFLKYPAAFTDELNIPESGNGIPDIINECRYELEWMLKMQREDGGVYHKLTSQNHADFLMPEEDLLQFYAFDVSSMAVADFCATMALCARVYQKYDADFAKKMEAAARKSWNWLETHPEPVLFRNPENSDTGMYGDYSDMDERLWAAVEMFYLAKDRKEDGTVYQNTAMEFLKKDVPIVDFGWTDVGGFASLAVLSDAEKSIGEEIYNICKTAVIAEAERLLELCRLNVFEMGMAPEDFCWGSSMVVTNRGILWSLAYELTGKEAYAEAVQCHVDYLLGKNITQYSFVTGFGTKPYKNPHSRPLQMDDIEEPVPGLVSGGPNGHPGDPAARKLLAPGTAPMKCFVDVWESYSTNEITIYWNSSAIYNTAFLRR